MELEILSDNQDGIQPQWQKDPLQISLQAGLCLANLWPFCLSSSLTFIVENWCNFPEYFEQNILDPDKVESVIAEIDPIKGKAILIHAQNFMKDN